MRLVPFHVRRGTRINDGPCFLERSVCRFIGAIQGLVFFGFKDAGGRGGGIAKKQDFEGVGDEMPRQPSFDDEVVLSLAELALLLIHKRIRPVVRFAKLVQFVDGEATLKGHIPPKLADGIGGPAELFGEQLRSRRFAGAWHARQGDDHTLEAA
jgi:hypothetical protein